MIRPATLDDLDALVALETRAFDNDRISRRSFRRMLTRGKAALPVDDDGGTLRGYALVLFHAGTPLARLYSIAVEPRFRSIGVGDRLLESAEAAARTRGCVEVRLELRRDNPGARAFYERHGYREFEIQPDYYEDHMDAVRMKKPLTAAPAGASARVPYYRQTLEFTCGPAALLMAMHALDPTLEPDRRLELRIWREATTVYMTSGHGGCSAYGLALSTHHRGFRVEVWTSGPADEMFVDSVRSEQKKAVIRLVNRDFLDEMAACGIALHQARLPLDAMQRAFEQGAIPVVLISAWRIYRQRQLHWVTVTGFDREYVYLHDPYVDEDENQSRTDCVDVPVPRAEFSRMARHRRSGQYAALLVRAGG